MTTDEIKAIAAIVDAVAQFRHHKPDVDEQLEQAATALRQLAEERDLWRQDFITSNAALARAQEERDREERLLRAGWRLHWTANDGYCFAHSDCDYRKNTWHTDRAEAARLAEEKLSEK